VWSEGRATADLRQWGVAFSVLEECMSYGILFGVSHYYH
jgi:hypothetical protein